MSGLLEKLKLPHLRGHTQPLDAQQQTLLHAEIIQQKPFLRKLYEDFYRRIKAIIDPTNSKVIIELGSGAGFIKEIIPNTLTSDVFDVPTVDQVFSACDMPFADNTVDAFVMFDVFHHIPDIRSFLHEASRTLKPNGQIVMVEPANTLWGRFVYTHFHHEAFDCSADWEFDSKCPLNTANGALPWIVFHRDRRIFEQEFPQLKITKTAPHTPLKYLLSGGLSLRQLLPNCCYPLISGLEWLISPTFKICGMFETIVLEHRLDT